MLGNFLTIFCLTGLALAASNSKVDQSLIEAFSNGKTFANIFVRFQGGNSVPLMEAAQSVLSGNDHVTHLVNTLKSYAASSQSNVLKLFRARHFSTQIETLWITNELYIKDANKDMVEELAPFPEVEEIYEETLVYSDSIIPSLETEGRVANGWNIERVKAHEVWELPGGTRGENVIVANIDDGINWSHEALRDNYRHDYGWFDPYDFTPEPTTLGFHGTHTMGTMAGSKGIGVAPGANWIACRGLYSGSGLISIIKRCGQWVMCPTNTNGTDPDCSKRAHVVSNSYGGSSGSTSFNDMINAWKAANIIGVFGIGNGGNTCGTAASPGDLDNVISVGAVDSSDMIAGLSASGPSFAGKIKPEMTAPGLSIRSASNRGDEYVLAGGTSMATPHVAGAVALLLSKNSSLTFEDVFRVLTENTNRVLPDTGRICGGIPSTVIPNNQYGYGILNARKAFEAI